MRGIWRGWIVPVGGSTPDRHKVGGSTPNRRKDDRHSPISTRTTGTLQSTPLRSRIWKGVSRIIDSCLLSVVPLLTRGWIVPVGGSTPDRHKVGGSTPNRRKDDRHSPISTRTTGTLQSTPLRSRIWKGVSRIIDSCLLSVVPLLTRGWIVPVGGSTPDRQKVGGSTPDRHRPAQVGGQPPIGAERQRGGICFWGGFVA